MCYNGGLGRGGWPLSRYCNRLPWSLDFIEVNIDIRLSTADSAIWSIRSSPAAASLKPEELLRSAGFSAAGVGVGAEGGADAAVWHSRSEFGGRQE